MSDLTAVTLFSGFGGKALGARAAGFQLVGAIEYDEAIAGVYSDNLGPHVTVGRVEQVDPTPYKGIDLLMASPVCKSFSAANSKGVESEDDMAAAEGVCRWLRVLRPPSFVMENVSGYRASASYKAITDTLDGLGYWWDARILNSADFGVPQTRKRLILRAVMGGFLPPLPAPTPWRGWYDAIEDLIPGLPESRFADWQMKRLPEFFGPADEFLVGGCNTSDTQAAPGVGVSLRGEPTRCVASNAGQWRALITRPCKYGPQERGAGFARASDPVMTVTTQYGQQKAWLIEGDAAGDRPPTRGASAEPCFTVKAAEGGRVHRAFLVEGTSSSEEFGLPVRQGESPAFTLKASSGPGRYRALLVDGMNARADTGAPTCGTSERPSMTIAASGKGVHRAWLEQGRVVAMTPRCLARFQSFPDDFRLSGKPKLDSTGIGNAIPPLLAEAVCAGLREVL